MRSLALIVVLGGSAAADGEVIEIEELRRLRPPTYEPAATTVIEGDELRRGPAIVADDALRAVPSLALFRRSSSLAADPTSQGVNLRGVGPSGVSRALVLRDGVPLNDPFGGWVYWRAMSLASIDRVEIQPSGASAVFGNFGLGGAVAIASRPITRRAVHAILEGGSHETGRASLVAADRLGALGLELDGELVRTAGVAPIAPWDRGAVDGRAGSRHASAGARVESAVAGGAAHGFVRWFDEHLDAGTQYTTADARALTCGARWRSRQLEVTAYAGVQRFAQERARVAADRSTAAPASSQRTPSANQGASAVWTAPVLGGTLQAGIDATRVAGRATDTLTPSMIDDATLVERTAGGEQRSLGAFVQHAARLGPVELGAALRADGWENLAGERRQVRGGGDVEVIASPRRRELELSPRLGALIHAGDHLAVRGSVYRAFRAPTLNELYRPFQVGTVLTAANDALAPETLWGAELGVQVALPEVTVRATWFGNRVTDPVFNATLPMTGGDTVLRMRQNLGRADVAGLELEAAWRPAVAWSVILASTYMNATVGEAPDHPELVGNRLAQVPHHRATGTLVWDEPRIATISASVRFTSAQFEDDANQEVLGAYVVVDASARRQLAAGLAAFASIHNAFDRQYLVGRAGVDTIGMPRTVLAGLAYDR